ncbi:MAG: dockerin type I domain-containing protein [Euryarchaeota archaeon]|nr:dockerin type I domain-containing protein [Euryarchaeota archaeon]
MLGIAGGVDGRSKNHYGLWMENIITSDPVKSNSGGKVIKYHEFSITSDIWICGDTNNNSKINSTDIVLLIKYTFYPEGIQINELTGDVDGSGCNTIIDSRLLIKHVFNETQYPLICK